MKTLPAFEYVIGLVGHPQSADVSWSDAQLCALREVGFNTLQLSLAWSWRPFNEVLNLENFREEPGHIAAWHTRVSQARKFGFRTLAHFGIPLGDMTDATTCILDPAVRDAYAERLRWFFREFPDVDDVMVYNYDQRAWLCSEFGPCPRCHGVPLADRLPGFIEMLIDAIQEVKPGARYWWEPWELSEGQIHAILDKIRTDHLGVIMHSTIAEVQTVNMTDLTFRNIARHAAQRGIPMIGEAFLGGATEEKEMLTHFPCPRLTWQQLRAIHECPGVMGVKEYYGQQPAEFSVNADMLKAYLRAPTASAEELLEPIAASYGAEAQRLLLDAWELSAFGTEVFPWNASWHMRQVWHAALTQEWTEVPHGIWPTPSWQANRRGFYMVIDQPAQHPWLKEDVGLRAHKAAELFERSVALLERAERCAEARRDDLRLQRRDVAHAAAVSRNFGRGLLAHRGE